MWFTPRSAAEAAIKVLTFQHKINGFVNVDSIQPILNNHNNNNTTGGTQSRADKQLDDLHKLTLEKLQEETVAILSESGYQKISSGNYNSTALLHQLAPYFSALLTHTGWSKNKATLHFAECVENYQRYLYDFLHTLRLVYAEYVCSLQV